ncbi:MAG: hypothetical protein EZS28_032155, partial [Streblomastix strix]
MKDNVSEATKDQAAISLGWLFHGIEIPVNMRRVIISRLKSGLENVDEVISNNSISTLRSLSQCSRNHTDIVSEDCLDGILKIM